MELGTVEEVEMIIEQIADGNIPPPNKAQSLVIIRQMLRMAKQAEQLHHRVAELESSSFNDDIVQLELCEKLATSQLENKRLREIGSSLLSELMEIAVANGANSVSMPDEYVEAAILLCAVQVTDHIPPYSAR